MAPANEGSVDVTASQRHAWHHVGDALGDVIIGEVILLDEQDAALRSERQRGGDALEQIDRGAVADHDLAKPPRRSAARCDRRRSPEGRTSLRRSSTDEGLETTRCRERPLQARRDSARHRNSDVAVEIDRAFRNTKASRNLRPTDRPHRVALLDFRAPPKRVGVPRRSGVSIILPLASNRMVTHPAFVRAAVDRSPSRAWKCGADAAIYFPISTIAHMHGAH